MNSEELKLPKRKQSSLKIDINYVTKIIVKILLLTSSLI